jgi:hypothetical protein
VKTAAKFFGFPKLLECVNKEWNEFLTKASNVRGKPRR